MEIRTVLPRLKCSDTLWYERPTHTGPGTTWHYDKRQYHTTQKLPTRSFYKL